MEKLIILFLTMPITLIMLFQPQLNEVEEARNTIAKVAIERGTALAAVEGYYSPSIIKEMKDMLKEVGYEENQIKLEHTQGVVNRGEYISARIEVPNEYTNILIDNMISSSEVDLKHVHVSSLMSEYVQ
ncbi:hypothetical protein GLW08_20460 [Pontibacillus yanchengensis]|uniref:Uncharacterized protein n=2 Tax=Pontibacillus yanchengensis TaxID=462910 RepID=A0ACC7VJS5_9BACI|nr:hypothetical protein [Pontibacillus yanchengensis]MYL35478.1 hypothetical protein [Pontibacillus yanchengensis]MYL55678.1 hypothetical protein [Pontibacillus yanchengensis]